MILSDREINRYVTGLDMIHPFEEKQLTPNGYDVSIEEIELINDVKLLLVDGTYQIPRKMTFIVLTKEKITMPTDMMGRLSIKTKYARQGLILSPGVVDAGFSGKLNLCFYNANENPVFLEKGKTIVQMVFEKMHDTAEKTYSERSGNYQNQKQILK